MRLPFTKFAPEKAGKCLKQHGMLPVRPTADGISSGDERMDAAPNTKDVYPWRT